MITSVREQICEAVKDSVASIQSGTDGYTTTWHQISRAPILDTDRVKSNAVAVYPVGQETKEAGTERMNCLLPLAVEFHLRVPLGLEPYTEAHRVMTDIERKIRENPRNGGLSINMVSNGNEVDVANYADRIISGVVFVTVQYRHHINDPREVM